MRSYLGTLSRGRLMLVMAPCVVALLLSGCNGSSDSAVTYTVGGSITGLASGQSVTLLDNGGDGYVATANGPFTFATPLVAGATYAVAVGTQPTNGTTQTQKCTVTNGSGTVGLTDVSNVSVSCLNLGYTSLYSFQGGTSDGQGPYGSVVMDASGNLYGTTGYGGAQSRGTAFKLDASGNETVLHSFGNVGDGQTPYGGLVMDTSGNLYGTTAYGGANGGYGTVFKIDASGTEGVLHSFNNSDGYDPTGNLILDTTGNLYGTTQLGGSGFGTVFKVDVSGAETVLHSFGGGGDGQGPYGGVVMDASGNLYGTTTSGGAHGKGTVFKIDTSGTKSELYSFAGGTADGASPIGGSILDASGNLYGTTSGGGANGSGTVFKLDPSGHETVLHSFGSGSDGQNPVGGLVMDANANLYGATSGGGANGSGTVFKLDPSGTETVLYSFAGGTIDGASPHAGAGLILGARGILYGTTYSGGAANAGTVFQYVLP